MYKSIILKDGRVLAYEEYGDLKGKPVFNFHGWPASRLSGQKLDQVAKKLNLRVISVDRPGFGQSSFEPNRQLLDWPDDVVELANKLKIKKFSVIGGSGGGPYVLACAYIIPQRLNSATIVAGQGKLNTKDTQGLTIIQRLFLKTYVFCGRIALPYVWLMKMIINSFPRCYLFFLTTHKAKFDKILYKNKNYQQDALASSKEAFRQGAKAVFQDEKIYCEDWGFRLEDIKMPIFLWHGEKDKNVPVWMAKYIAARLQNCQVKYLPNYGHYLFLTHAEEILKKV